MSAPTYRPIETKSFGDVEAPSTFGRPPKLEWLAIRALVVDPDYQRDIGRRGRLNILRIASAFSWSKFSTVIVSPIGGDRYAIVDGQHRVTAAALVGVDRVPCQIIEANRAEQADVFAAVNTVVTAMSPLQIHAAKLAAGDDRARRLDEVCRAASVTICRYPLPANKMKPGDTLAAGKLYALLEKYGPDVLRGAMKCITGTRKGYPGLMRPALVEAFCVNLEAEPEWSASEPRLLKVIQRLDLGAAYADALAKTAGSRAGLTAELVDAIGAHIEEHFAKVAA
jgi:hypothetical protein